MKPFTGAKMSETDFRARYIVAVGLVLVFLVFFWANLTFRIPLIPILATVFAFLALIELVSICYHSRITNHALIIVALHALIITFAILSVWIIERFFCNWSLIILAIVVPVFAQNMFAYFIGSRWLPRVRNRRSAFVRFLHWHSFRSSPRKAAGTAIVTSLLALVVTLPWTFQHPLLFSIVLIASLTAAFGDLLESYLKRLVHIENSGEHLRRGRSIFAYLERVVGSHGGFLDRFDSLFFCLALIFPVLVTFIGLGS